VSASKFRVQLVKLISAFKEEREFTQKQHFELRRLIAGKQYDKAIALLNDVSERDANIVSGMSRFELLHVEEALKLLDKETEEP